MGDQTGIEWTDATWNPVTGCTKVSPGCDHCYAETIAHRFAGTKAYPDGFAVTLRPERMDQPLRWTKPRRIFVNSMSDLFHDDIPDDYIARVFAVMAATPQHTFQILTKRHGRMRSLLQSHDFNIQVIRASAEFPSGPAVVIWPLRNVWLGVSAENQQWADIRIPALLETPAAVRFVSAEPLLGPIRLFGDIENPGPGDVVDAWSNPTDYGTGYEHDASVTPLLDWVIVGGESGRGARPMHPEWVQSIRDQCTAAGVAFHFKQWGEWEAWPERDQATHLLQVTGQLVTRESATMKSGPGRPQDLVDRGHPGWVRVRKVGKKRAGRQLDGRTWDEFPEDGRHAST